MRSSLYFTFLWTTVSVNWLRPGSSSLSKTPRNTPHAILNTAKPVFRAVACELVALFVKMMNRTLMTSTTPTLMASTAKWKTTTMSTLALDTAGLCGATTAAAVAAEEDAPPEAHPIS